MEFVVEEVGDLIHVTTVGMVSEGRPELTVVDVNPDQLEDAKDLLTFMGENILENSAEAGERVGIEYPTGMVAVRIVEFEKPHTGLRAMFRRPRTLHALVDVAETQLGRPSNALATLANMRADHLAQYGHDREALLVRMGSVSHFSGEELPDDSLAYVDGYNWQNSLTYLQLSLDATTREHEVFMLDRAVRRSSRISTETLGASLADFEDIDARDVRQRAELIVSVALSDDQIDIGEERFVSSRGTAIVSPLWEPSDEFGGERRILLLPEPIAEMLRLPKLATLGEEVLVEFITSVFLSMSPVELACALRPSLYLLHQKGGPRVYTGSVHHPADYLLSALVAHVARCCTVGDLEFAREILEPEPSSSACELHEVLNDMEIAALSVATSVA